MIWNAPMPLEKGTLQERLRSNPEMINPRGTITIDFKRYQKLIALMNEAADEIDLLLSTHQTLGGGK